MFSRLSAFITVHCSVLFIYSLNHLFYYSLEICRNVILLLFVGLGALPQSLIPRLPASSAQLLHMLQHTPTFLLTVAVIVLQKLATCSDDGNAKYGIRCISGDCIVVGIYQVSRYSSTRPASTRRDPLYGPFFHAERFLMTSRPMVLSCPFRVTSSGIAVVGVTKRGPMVLKWPLMQRRQGGKRFCWGLPRKVVFRGPPLQCMYCYRAPLLSLDIGALQRSTYCSTEPFLKI